MREHDQDAAIDLPPHHHSARAYHSIDCLLRTGGPPRRDRRLETGEGALDLSCPSSEPYSGSPLLSTPEPSFNQGPEPRQRMASDQPRQALGPHTTPVYTPLRSRLVAKARDVAGLSPAAPVSDASNSSSSSWAAERGDVGVGMNSIDPTRSFLALTPDSSPTGQATPESDDPFSVNSLLATRTGASFGVNRGDEETSFLPTTSPFTSRFDNGQMSDTVMTPVRKLDANKPPLNSRGSRLGAQMGRSKSNQPTYTGAQHHTGDLSHKPVSSTGYEAQTAFNSVSSPIKRNEASVGQDTQRTTFTSNDRQAISGSSRLTTAHEGQGRGADIMVPSTLAGPSLPFNLAHADGSGRRMGSNDAALVKGPISVTPSHPSRRTNESLGNGTVAEEEMSSSPLQHRHGEAPRQIKRTSSHGDMYSAAAASSSSSSPQVSSPDRLANNLVHRTGKLSRLQYNKRESNLYQSAPAWDLSNTSTRSPSALHNRTSLMGRASNPNMLADYKRGESFSESQGVGSSRQSSNSSNAQDDPTRNSSLNDHSTTDTNNSSSRGNERRELILPALNEMRNAVQGVVATPAENFIKKGDKRRSTAALHALSLKPTPSKEENRGGNAAQQSILEPGDARELHLRTSSLETNPSPALTEGTWQHASNEAKQSASLAAQHDFSLSSSPLHKSMGVMQEHNPLEIRQNAKLGQLSDEAIVQLGAVPGVQPSSLLNTNGQSLSSKNILTIALQKAQNAVLLDSSNNVPDAIMAYRQAVRLLKEVMERVSPKNATRSSRKTSREEERRRLKVIHDTYADRIRLLSMIYSPDDEPGDSSLGDESFARRSPSPLPLRGSREVANTGALDGLGIGGSPEAVGQTLTPQIAISGESSPTFKKRSGVEQEETREEMLNEGDYSVTRSSLQRSDSGGSYQSARDPAGRTSGGAAGLALPIDPAARGRWQARGLSVEEELSTPTTPYFDIDPHLVSATESPVNAKPAASQEDDDEWTRSTPEPSTISQSGERRSRNPQDRINRGVASLHNVPSAQAIAAKESQSSRQPSRRFLSVGSDALFQREMATTQSSPSRRQVDEMAKSGAQDADHATVTDFQGRPRASTMGTAKGPSEVGKALVNSNVANGTISQRRKIAAGESMSSTGGLGGSSDDEPIAAHLRGFSPSPSDLNTVKDRAMGSSTASAEVSERETGSRASAGRKRAISQPNHRRPSIPASFMAAHQVPPGAPDGPPPVPRISRKSSMPLSPLVGSTQQGTIRVGGTATGGHSGGTAGFRFPSPSPSTSSGYHALGTPGTPNLYPWPGSGEGKGAIISDLFATSLPSVQMGAPPSFASNSLPVSLPWIGLSNFPVDASPPGLLPSQKNLRPFCTMKLLLASIERGAYLTRRLYLPRDLWLQSGSRLLAIESKVRMLDSISSGIDGIDQAGHFLLHPTNMDQPGLNAINASRFLKLLEDFETLLIEVQNTLAKKLGFLETVAGKKASSSFGSLGSRLTRSLDRMTNNSKHLDTPATYVEGLARLFSRAQVLGDHLRTLHRSKSGSGGDYKSASSDSEWDSINVDSYATLPAELKRNIEVKLQRFSDFFTNVVLRFVLRDVAILVDK